MTIEKEIERLLTAQRAMGAARSESDRMRACAQMRALLNDIDVRAVLSVVIEQIKTVEPMHQLASAGHVRDLLHAVVDSMVV